MTIRYSNQQGLWFRSVYQDLHTKKMVRELPNLDDLSDQVNNAKQT